MEIKQHIGFRNELAPELLSYLRKNSICFSGDKVISSLEITESNPHWEQINRYIKMYGISTITETEFSKNELSQAEWLRIRSIWKNGYPQPENDYAYEELTYTREQCCDECGCGLIQIDAFRLNKQTNWGKRHFFELNWVGDEIFTSNIAKTVFDKNKITGITFRCVKNKSNTDRIPDTYQLAVPFLLEKGLDLERTVFKKIYICPQCKETKYLHSGRGPIAFKKEIFTDAPDIVKTQEIFGDGHYATRLILIRQKVYQTIIENNLEKGLVFEKVELT